MSGNLSIRNVDDAVIAGLKQRARDNGRSTEAEVRQILADALSGAGKDEFAELAAKLRKMTAGRQHASAETLIREDRDEAAGPRVRGTPAQAAARIREARKNNFLPDGMTIRDLMTYGRD